MFEMASDEDMRKGIRKSLAECVKKQECGGDVEQQCYFKNKFIEFMKKSEICDDADVANEQHYEVPTELFLTILGKRLTYSGMIFADDSTTLDEAEEATLKIICERAKVEDGQTVLDFGCGWGSLTLYLLEKFPNCRVTSVSNSKTQKAFITSRAEKQGHMDRLTCITADANVFQTEKRFDRIISIEMIEHLKNYEKLFQRISTWLKPNGRFFVHIFCHRQFPNAFEPWTGEAMEWMGKNYSSGICPSADLLLYFQNDLIHQQQWYISGKHYAKTGEAWLQKLDQNKDKVSAILTKAYGAEAAPEHLANWRKYCIYLAEIFNFNGGNEWMVAYHLFCKRA